MLEENYQSEFDVDNHYNHFEKQNARFTFGKFVSLVLILTSLTLLGFGGYFGYQILASENTAFVCEDGENCSNQNLFGDLIGGIFGNEIKLKGQAQGRTNFLMLGLDSAASLADTIIIASLFYEEKKIVTLNIPRDLYVSTSYQTNSGSKQNFSGKVNSLYPLADSSSNRVGAGVEALSNFINSEYGIEIHYWMNTNFEGLEKVVNELGGITVNVDKAFTDCEFPNKNYRGFIRPCPSFETGVQEMDGETALIYARSRMAPQDGGDFARSRRQSIVIQGIVEKAKQLGVIDNINNINNYLSIFSEYLETNIKPSEILALNKVLNRMNLSDDFLRLVWEDGNGIYCTGDPARGYNLVYCGGLTPGIQQSSQSREKAQNQVREMLFYAQSQELFSARTAILGNQSKDTVSIRDDLFKAGMNNVYFNNLYSSEIKAATLSSTEKAIAYIDNPRLLDPFKTLINKVEKNIEVVEGIPGTLNIPAAANKPEIIIWVESI